MCYCFFQAAELGMDQLAPSVRAGLFPGSRLGGYGVAS